MLKQFANFLSGKKTYIAAFCMIIAGIIIEDHSLILEAIAIMGLRNAIK